MQYTGSKKILKVTLNLFFLRIPLSSLGGPVTGWQKNIDGHFKDSYFDAF